MESSAQTQPPPPAAPVAPQAAYYPSQPVVAPVATPKTSGMAIASLVLGILWLYGIGSVLAIIFGAVAKSNIRDSNGWVTGSGMATAGLVLGIIGTVGALIVIVAAAGS